MSEEQHVALPHLYGAPAYSRPPRPVEEIPRPFDPDELPIEADRSDDEAGLLGRRSGAGWAPSVALTSDGHADLQGRPFRLRGLSRIFGGDQK